MYGDLVRRARQLKELSQTELAELSGVAQPNLSAIEHDRRVPTAETLHRLLSACGFALIADDGHDRLVLPWPDSGPESTATEAETIAADTPIVERVRALTAALEASDAIVRARA